jgi:hypothetical protein
MLHLTTSIQRMARKQVALRIDHIDDAWHLADPRLRATPVKTTSPGHSFRFAHIARLGAVALLTLPFFAAPGAAEAPDLLHDAKPAEATTRPALLTYSLSDGSEKWDADARQRIVHAMDAAVAVYNANGEFKRHLIANFNPGTPTADANFGGWINFGGQIGTRTALHEIAHTLGVGTTQQWQHFAKDGLWTGHYAIQQLKEIDGPNAILHCDHQHFWPYGLNYENEGGPENFKRHVKMVIALRADMGLGPPPGISQAALKTAQLDAAAAHDQVLADQKALDALPATLKKQRDADPSVVAASSAAATAKAQYDSAVAKVIKSLQNNTDYQSATSDLARAHQRLDELKAENSGGFASQDQADAAGAVLTAQSKLTTLQKNAIEADPDAQAAGKANLAAIQSLKAAYATVETAQASQFEAAKSALEAAKSKALAADQHVAEIKDGLATEKNQQAAEAQANQ